MGIARFHPPGHSMGGTAAQEIVRLAALVVPRGYAHALHLERAALFRAPLPGLLGPGERAARP